MRTLILLLVPGLLAASPVHVSELATKHMRSLVGTVEATGKNDGPVIKTILSYVGLPEGQPYCAATVIYAYGKAASPKANPLPKIPRVATLWSVAQKSPKFYCYTKSQVLSGVYKAKAGDVFVMLFGAGPNPNGHTGTITGSAAVGKSNTIEGNTMPTDVGNQREGGGIYQRVRNNSAFVGVIRVL